MALQSQTLRSSNASRAYDTHGRGGQKKIAGFVLLLVLTVAFGYWYLGPRRAAAQLDRGVDPTPAVTRNVTPDGSIHRVTSMTPSPAAPLTPAPKPDPTVLSMGSRPSNQQAPISTSSAPSTASVQTVKDPLAETTQPSDTNSRDPQPLVPMPIAMPMQATSGSMNLSALPPDLAQLIQSGERSASENKLVEARTALNKALADTRTSENDRLALRGKIADINQTLVFSPALAPGDPLSSSYNVEKGDSLVKIVRKQQTVSEPGLIQRINRIANPNALRVGQSLKLIRGPFHAVVSKSRFRMDVYAGPVPSPGSLSSSGLADGIEPNWMYIRSFAVGLGEKGTTPLGNFTVKENSKLVNPFWVNPRTGEKFDADDPKNPIGERWIGLEGLNIQDKAFTGYGVHGTIQPDSIGREMSMGCVRMNTDDVEVVYELLMPRVSVVKIMP